LQVEAAPAHHEAASAMLEMLRLRPEDALQLPLPALVTFLMSPLAALPKRLPPMVFGRSSIPFAIGISSICAHISFLD
jgi:hypothetical protein